MFVVLQIGRIPENAGIGGVTLHVYRLLYHLEQNGIHAELCDYKTTRLFEQLKKIVRSQIMHVHISHPALRFLYVLFAFILRKKVVLTIHGNLGRFGFIYNLLDIISITLSSVPVILNENSYSKSLRYNCNAQFLTAFLPPLPYECKVKDEHLKIFRLLREQYKKIYITNASRYVFDDANNEIYGLSFLIENFKSMEDSCLVISDPSGENALQYAKAAPVNVKFINTPHSFFSLIKLSDCIIRATSTDGDSLTIREGLYCGIPVIATNCISRPIGCILFNYGDNETFHKSLDFLKALQAENKVASNMENGVYKYIDIYSGLSS